MADAAHVGGHIATKRAPDHAIAALADRQHGVVSRTQLLALGVGAGAIKRRREAGRLQLLHRGVYAVGHRALRREAWWMAAVLAAGDGAVLSHRSAAALWGIRETSRTRIEVSVPRHRRSTARLEVHVISMRPDEITVKRGIPVTTPARTLLDLAAVVSEDVEHAFNEAEFRRLSSPTSLDALLTRYPNRKGTTALRRVLENHRKNGETVTRSRLERRFLSLIDAHDLRARRSTAPPPTASSTPAGPTSGSSWSATALPPTACAVRSSATGLGTGGSSSPAGAWSGSPGAS